MKDMVGNELTEYNDERLSVLLSQYNCINSVRENCMQHYSNSNFYFGFIIALTTATIYQSHFDFIFLFIPFLVIIQNSIILFNQYHQFVAEAYLVELENKINRINKDFNIGFYTYYNALFKKNVFKSRSSMIPFIKPTAILAATLAVVNIGIFIYAMERCSEFLEKYPILRLSYLSISSGLLILTIIGFVFMPKHIKPLLQEFINKQG